jgi:quercetin dioxygenase-like cupin family protein
VRTIAHADRALEEWRTGVRSRMHVSALNGATELCIFEQWIEPGASAPTHAHPVEEVLTVLEGKAEVWIEDERNVVTAGHSVIVPPRQKHGFRNIGSEILHLHAALASGIFEATFDSGTVRRWRLPDSSGESSVRIDALQAP